VDGADPPRALLEEIYDNIVNNEIKMQKKGDPEKTGK
jgi:Sec7-like guanine-nucleotide exchange factor